MTATARVEKSQSYSPPPWMTPSQVAVFSMLPPELLSSDAELGAIIAHDLAEKAGIYLDARRGLAGRERWRVHVLAGIAGAEYSYSRGAVVDMPIERARSLIAAGAAASLEPPEMETAAKAWGELSAAAVSVGLDFVAVARAVEEASR